VRQVAARLGGEVSFEQGTGQQRVRVMLRATLRPTRIISDCVTAP
jgi:hypothetical protein